MGERDTEEFMEELRHLYPDVSEAELHKIAADLNRIFRLLLQNQSTSKAY